MSESGLIKKLAVRPTERVSFPFVTLYGVALSIFCPQRQQLHKTSAYRIGSFFFLVTYILSLFSEGGIENGVVIIALCWMKRKVLK